MSERVIKDLFKQVVDNIEGDRDKEARADALRKLASFFGDTAEFQNYVPDEGSEEEADTPSEEPEGDS